MRYMLTVRRGFHPGHPALAPTAHFLWHFAEMVIAMMVGMAIFGGLRAALDPTGFADALREHLDLRYLAMTVFMAVPMVPFMRYRGHSWERSAEMVAAMAVPVVVVCLLWRVGLGSVVPIFSDSGLKSTTHNAMFVGMLAAMVYRFGEYAHTGGHKERSPSPQAT
jgi:hypothetical protein